MIFEFLSYGPRSFEEIRERLVECGVANKYYSIDTIRIDLNTLKSIGCDIKKATKTNNYKYELVSHPFMIKISTRELSTLKKVYKKIAKIASPQLLLDYHYMLQKLSRIVEGENFKEQVDFNLPDIDIYRNLFVIEKVSATPKKFPRKAGLPAKEPLK